MIPNHTQFIEAIQEKRKVRVRFYSRADSGVLDRVCGAMDYGPGTGMEDGLHRYWLWNYASNTDAHLLGLLPQEIVELHVLGELFNPAEFGPAPAQWFTPRDWGLPAPPVSR
jgi:hypothetical protein